MTHVRSPREQRIACRYLCRGYARGVHHPDCSYTDENMKAQKDNLARKTADAVEKLKGKRPKKVD